LPEPRSSAKRQQKSLPHFFLSLLLYFIASLIQRFHHHRNPLAAADTRRGQSISQPVAPEFIQNGNEQSGAGSSQRMPESNRSSIHIRFVTIESQNFLHRQILRCKCFVDLQAIHLI